ncbi:HAD hydrolase family protein [Paenibacillus sp. MMS18-CY102]|uniref:HAD hydrolase family protein n=1 Tax=Paenibacillus sp. MMS18-CY102 TaxID=2682849 RepID=UPI001365A26C|nr:HAD hydrolase family protein [Paenibacillus sp. MMS18-CY102]MWC28949.1 HAD hydrolase family protein [Paenibacillus sp. MMS18-CY102]
MSRYILTDLDGTLLTSGAQLSDYTVRIFNDALEAGAVISFATARSYQSSMAATSRILWRYPLVLYNGSMLFDPVHHKVLGGHWLENGKTNEIISIGREMALVPLLFALDDADRERVLHERLTREGDQRFFASRPGDPRFTEVSLLQCPPSYRTLIVTYIGLREELEPLFHAITERYGAEVHVHFMRDTYIGNHYFLEISHPLANKEHGMRLWCEHVGCLPEDVTVFGDNLNDIGLFKRAGTRLAVSGAHRELKLMASRVIGSNDEDGVAKEIETYYF